MGGKARRLNIVIAINHAMDITFGMIVVKLYNIMINII